MKQLKDKVMTRPSKGPYRKLLRNPLESFTGNPAKGRLALITTGGVHSNSQPPFDMKYRHVDQRNCSECG